jgi:Flp pilus assembly protein TadG
MRVLTVKRRRARRGAAAAEFAMLLPLMVLIILGCVDFGRFAYDLIAVTNAARAGASYGIMNNFSSSTLAAWKSSVTTAATSEMSGQDDYHANNLTVSVPDPTTDANGLKRMSITVSYQFQSVVDWTWAGYVLPYKPTLSRTVQMRIIR